MNEFLRATSPPFILTLVAAALAWWVTHTVDRLADQPIVVFSIEESESKCGQAGKCTKVLLTIENISSQKFSHVLFELQVREKASNFVGAAASVVTPPTNIKSVSTPVNDSIQVEFEELHPGFNLAITTHLVGPQGVVLILKKSDHAMKLVRPSPETFFLKHEFWILSVALSAFLVLGVAVLTRSPSSAFLVAAVLGTIIFVVSKI